jgi:M6 family metalloprotease-like protein
MTIRNKCKRLFLLDCPAAIIVLLFILLHMTGAPLRDVPQQLTQPDGTLLNCYASGDEYHNWLHDGEGFTIIQDARTGFYVYAQKVTGGLVPTEYIAGKDDPVSAGLQPGANISPNEVMRKRDDFNRLTAEVQRWDFGGVAKSAYQRSSFDNMNNIVIFIRFSDDDEFDQEINVYDDLYNKQGDGVISLYEYYQEVSYEQIEIFSHFLPVSPGPIVISFQDSNPRAYYREKSLTNSLGYEGQNERIEREHTLLKSAINHVESQIPQHINLDNDNNDMVDCMSFVVRGRPEGWNELLWPHMWMLFSQEVFIRDKRVWDYTFQFEEDQVSSIIQLGTVAHEMFHILGAPDLYRYDESGFVPVGPWDLMAMTSNIPQHMGAYMKYLYGGWIDEIPVITESGSYELVPLHNKYGSYFRIPSAHSPYEFFVVEYRNSDSIFDSTLPGEGLIVYRINTLSEGFGNFHAPDEVYIYRPHGTLTSNGDIINAYFTADVGRTEITDNTSLAAFLSDGAPSGLQISNIGSANETITFDVTIEYDPPVTMRYDGGSVFSSIGMGQAGTIEVAIRLTNDVLSGFYGHDLTAIVVCIDEGGGNDVTLKVWEGGSYGSPGTLVHTEYVGDAIELGGWSVHNLNEPVKLKEELEYWVGYSINTTGGYPVVLDGGPVINGKGAWLNTEDGWEQLNNYGFDSNLRIWAVLEMTSTAILSIDVDALDIEVHPEQTKNTTLRISNPGNAQLTFSISASGGESAVSKVTLPDLPRSGLHPTNKMSADIRTKINDRMQLKNNDSVPGATLKQAYTSANVELILDDGDDFADSFSGIGAGYYYYWRNDFLLDADFDLEGIRFFMRTESASTNSVDILVAGDDRSFLYDTTVVYDLSSEGKWYEFYFPQHILNTFQFKEGQTFTLIVGALNLDVAYPAGYDIDGLKPGYSYYGYYYYVFNWYFSGWINLNTDVADGAFLIRAVGNADGSVENQLPVAVAQVSPNPANIDQPVTFDGVASYDPDGHITNYVWEFGDGQTSNQMTTNHLYSQVGQFTYTLTVTDNDGATDQTTGQITISDSPSRWTLNPSSGNIPAGSFCDIEISFNSKGLPEGNYKGELNITSNAGIIIVPITIVISATVDVDDIPDVIYSFKLEQNYPNPFNPSTTIRFSIPERHRVRLSVYDLLGREVTKLIDEEMEAGWYSVIYNAEGLASGVYLYRIQTESFISTKRFIILK